jgi:dTDP-4-amino-4,6-dideoxygalactose transaminase
MTRPRQTIPLFKPLIEQEELDAARDALKLGWLGMGSYVAEFERQMAAFIGAEDRKVVAVSTGHAALHLALLLAGAGPGDEVITPSFNNAADFQAILATGAEPVFCDVRDDTLCIDLDKAERLVSSRTKAIIVTDYACLLCDHDYVDHLTKRLKLRLVHDAAHSFGSRYKGRMIGSFNDLTIFSYDPIKTITCIDGGAVFAKNEDDIRRLAQMRLLGMSQSTNSLYHNSRAFSYDISTIGFRYHMANLHAAVGLVQLAKMDIISESRRVACRHYNEQLGQIPEVRVPATDFVDGVPFLYYIRIPARRRDPLRAHLAELGIETGVHWQPGHQFTLLQGFRRGDVSVTERVGEEILSLPLHSRMPLAMVDRVAEAIRGFFGQSR